MYRVIQDDASGCRSLLYLNNVTTGVYSLALFVFSTLLMVGVSIICLLVIFITNIVSTSKLLSIALSLLIGSLETALCTLFLGVRLVSHTQHLRRDRRHRCQRDRLWRRVERVAGVDFHSDGGHSGLLVVLPAVSDA